MTPAQDALLRELVWMDTQELSRLAARVVMGWGKKEQAWNDFRPLTRRVSERQLVDEVVRLGIAPLFGQVRRRLPHTLTGGARTCIAAIAAAWLAEDEPEAQP